jgi:hypothetical protein
VGAVATVAAAALPVVSEPELGMFEWMEQAELDAIKRFPLAFGPIVSRFPEGSWQYDADHEAQSFSQAMSQVAAVDRKRE